MKKLHFTAFALALVATGSYVPTAPAQSPPAKPPANDSNFAGYPEEVALSQEGSKGWVYRRFPGGQRLYVHDLDKDGTSACNKGCDGAWVPVYAPPTSVAKGPWTLIVRYDGSRQWVYMGRPVYTLYHDDPAHPGGDGQSGVWHLLPFNKHPQWAKKSTSK